MPRAEIDAFDRMYLDHGLTSTADGSISILAGSGIGGGTTINWMTSIAAPDPVRAGWARAHGIAGFDAADGDADYAAIAAELSVTETSPIPPKDALLVRGATALGLEAARPGATRLAATPAARARSAAGRARSSRASRASRRGRGGSVPGSCPAHGSTASCSRAAASAASRRPWVGSHPRIGTGRRAPPSPNLARSSSVPARSSWRRGRSGPRSSSSVRGSPTRCSAGTSFCIPWRWSRASTRSASRCGADRCRPAGRWPRSTGSAVGTATRSNRPPATRGSSRSPCPGRVPRPADLEAPDRPAPAQPVASGARTFKTFAGRSA
jgi:hypothetical protein